MTDQQSRSDSEGSESFPLLTDYQPSNSLDTGTPSCDLSARLVRPETDRLPTAETANQDARQQEEMSLICIVDYGLKLNFTSKTA